MKTRITEHKRDSAMFDHDSKIFYHVHKNNHEMDLEVSELLHMRLTFTSNSFRSPVFKAKFPHSGLDVLFFESRVLMLYFNS